MRPILLKSAGIVGLAGAIMAVVSSNALFVDPGGPPRGEASAPAASEDSSAPPATVFALANPSAGTAITPREVTVVPIVPQSPMAPQSVAAEPQAPAEDPVPDQSSGAAQTSAPTPTASAPTAIAPATTPAEPVQTAAVVAPQAAADTVASAMPASPAADPPTRVAEVDASTTATDPAPSGPAGGEARDPWTKAAMACPRDWVAVADTESSHDPSVDCPTIAALVEQAPSIDLRGSLAKALPPHVLDVTALAPAMPLPKAQAKSDAAQDPATTEVAPAPTPKPAPVKVSAHPNWPDAAPPDCGSKHAYWRFVEGHHGKKEWYCK